MAWNSYSLSSNRAASGVSEPMRAELPPSSGPMRVGLGWLPEDAVDDGGLLGGADAEVAGCGLDGGLSEECLDLRGVGAALYYSRCFSVGDRAAAQRGAWL